MLFHVCIIYQFLSSENDLSDDEDLISRETLVVLPPNDESDRHNNKDWVDENELPPNNLSRSQLLAGATVDLRTSSSNILLGAGGEEEVADPSVDVPSERNKRSKVNKYLKAWRNMT